MTLAGSLSRKPREITAEASWHQQQLPHVIQTRCGQATVWLKRNNKTIASKGSEAPGYNQNMFKHSLSIIPLGPQ